MKNENEGEPCMNKALVQELHHFNENLQCFREILLFSLLQQWYFDLDLSQQQRLSAVKLKVLDRWISAFENQ